MGLMVLGVLCAELCLPDEGKPRKSVMAFSSSTKPPQGQCRLSFTLFLSLAISLSPPLSSLHALQTPCLWAGPWQLCSVKNLRVVPTCRPVFVPERGAAAGSLGVFFLPASSLHISTLLYFPSLEQGLKVGYH